MNLNEDEININNGTFDRLETDKEFLKYFLENFDEIIENTEPFEVYALSRFLTIPEVKNKMHDNFLKVVKKVKDRINIIKILSVAEQRKYLEYLFTKNELQQDIDYGILIKYLKIQGLVNDSQILNLVIENIDNVIVDSGENFSDTMKELYQILDCASQDQISKIDEALVRNIKHLQNSVIWGFGYDFNWFEKMENFKEEIRKIGPEFFINFPISNTPEEFPEISFELFGRYDVEIFTIMKFGAYDKDKVKLMECIIQELMKASSTNVSVSDIKKIGRGHYSTVYKVGDYILKEGHDRGYYRIPNHRRLIQPIIRRMFESKQKIWKNKTSSYFIEVQNYTDINWWKDMNEEQIEEVLFEIYCDLRDSRNCMV